MKKVNIKTVAALSGYSVSTVSKALNGTDRVGKEAKEKIKKIASTIGYQSNFSAQSLARKTRIISIILFDSPNEVRSLFEIGFNSAFDLYGEFGMEPIFYFYNQKNRNSYDLLPWDEIYSQSDAVILIPGGIYENHTEILNKIGRKIPLVILQSKLSDKPQIIHTCDVTVNAGVVGAMAAQYIGVSIKEGDTAIITGYKNGWIHSENISGFLSSAQSFKLNNVAIEESFDDMEKAYNCTNLILSKFPSVKGIFVTSYVSPAVCKAVYEKGRDIKIVGVDLFKESSKCLKTGTLSAVIFQNQKKQAELAIEVVANIFRGSTTSKEIYVKPELVLKSNMCCYGID